MRSLYVIILTVLAATASAQYTRDRARNAAPLRGVIPKRPHPCERSSCYPATGNLLIGRESKLYASSTCGLKGPERYCIVSHLEDRKKCFRCDTGPHTEHDPLLNHRVQNIIYRYHPGTRVKSWWQSENGKENVTIQLDLEAEFHFTHLIIVFKTFRPAAMLVERSFDFGKTWRVYRYFAHNCDDAFPGVSKTSPRVLTDVICESRYSGVAPSTDGEIIFRVLWPNINVENPYSQEVQDLLKMTNLRLNFTKLHTLGDDLLDNRAEIQEKYYYAITEMTVRGSCSCYGHAYRCLPLPGVESKTDMVHGRCECTHNTKGLNCEFCEDFFNDLPWKPAVGKITNACKRCTCNNHATSCHFDPAVYERTGKVSGGVCDDCQHNTLGQNCERCKPFYYQDPTLDIQNPEICKPCDCDPQGSLDDGLCDSITDLANNQSSGRCHCKKNIEGRRCDTCKDGYWDFSDSNPDGCQVCTCNKLGTIDDRGCDVGTGECTCKRYVTGRDCNQCLPEFYGLSDNEEGCSPCDCDIGGSMDNNCDVISGQCRCRHNVQGRRCDLPIQHYFSGSLDFLVHEAEASLCVPEDENAINPNCQVMIREPFRGQEATWTGPGFMRVFEDDILKFKIDDIATTLHYNILIRYEPQANGGDWQEVKAIIHRFDPINSTSLCASYQPDRDVQQAVLPLNGRSQFFPSPVCLEAGKNYELILHFNRQNSQKSNSRASILIDSIVLIPDFRNLPFFNGNTVANYRRREFESNHCNDPYYFNVHKANVPDICKKYHMSIGLYVFDGAISCRCDPTGSISHKCEEHGGTCPCKVNVVGRACNRCAPGTFGFGPEGCKACDCNNIGALDNFCDTSSGQCKCSPNTYGRQCNNCQPGYWNFPNCQQCECNGHADICDSLTGACIDCREFSAGHKCDRCIEGFYGDPRLGNDIACRPCPCPGTHETGHSFADICNLDVDTKDVICNCEEGYSGQRCDVCDDNYFGRPDLRNGSCQACDCSNNVDITKPHNCDTTTGQCLQCLSNTEGFNCEVCRSGFYGNALKQSCVECVCDILGTNTSVGPCDRKTGQCPCFKNVIGLNCDQCLEDHWKIASGEGCESCDCDGVGSTSPQCNKFDGQCSCKPGFGGRKCDECQTNYWGDPNNECYACDCDTQGAISSQCLRDNGTCVCRSGIGGHKCNTCARGYLGESPNCFTCGECFDNWDRIINELELHTNNVIFNASQIKKVGATGAYTRDFDEMENKIQLIQKLITNTDISEDEIKKLQHEVDIVTEALNKGNKSVGGVNELLVDLTSHINLNKADLDGLLANTKKLNDEAELLDYNATKLQEANLEGALNLTREAKEHAIKATDDADQCQTILGNSERQIKSTERLIEGEYSRFNETQKDIDIRLVELQGQLGELELKIPDLNDKMCGQASDSCDGICGGAGCGKCGGISCENGAVTKANQALDFANKTELSIKDQESRIDDLLREISLAKQDTDNSLAISKQAFDAANTLNNLTEYLTEENKNVTASLSQFFNTNRDSPEEVRKGASRILEMSINLQPQKITDLANEINNTASQLTNIESIIEDTRADLERAESIKNEANEAKSDAAETLSTANNILETLKEANVAQKAAEEAIKQSNEDIEIAKSDLNPINTETDQAQRKANETANETERLRLKLGNLQKNILKMENDAQQIKGEAGDVVAMAEAAQQQARDLRQNYEVANSSLTMRADQSANSRERAEMLLKRATKLASETQTQYKDLQNMEDLYNSHTSQLNNLQNRISDLNDKMNQYLAEINMRSDWYRTCVNI